MNDKQIKMAADCIESMMLDAKDRLTIEIKHGIRDSYTAQGCIENSLDGSFSITITATQSKSSTTT